MLNVVVRRCGGGGESGGCSFTCSSPGIDVASEFCDPSGSVVRYSLVNEIDEDKGSAE